jgi:hypothetical protein
MQIRFARFSCFRSCAPESTCPSVGSARLASSVCDLVNTLRVRCCVPMANIVSARLVKQDLVISLSAGPSSIFIVNSIMSVVLSINNSCIINTLWVSECRMRTLSYSSIKTTYRCQTWAARSPLFTCLRVLSSRVRSARLQLLVNHY